MSMIVITWPARDPIAGLEDAELQFRLRAKYKNDLIGIERRRRQLDQEVQRHVCPVLAAASEAARKAEEAYDACAGQMKAERGRTRRRKAEEPDGLAAAKAARAAAWEAEKAAKLLIRGPVAPSVAGCEGVPPAAPKRRQKPAPGAHLWAWDGAGARFVCAACQTTAPPVTPPGPCWAKLKRWRDEMFTAAGAALREARGEASAKGLQFSNYQRAEDAVRRMSGPELPRFRFDDGTDGETAVHVQALVTTAELFEGPVAGLCIERCSYERYLGDRWRGDRPAGARAKRTDYALVHLRAGGRGREPRYLVLPVCASQPLPQGAVKWAWARRRDGRWSVQFVIETTARTEPVAPGGTIAIDLGWRPVQGGLRVAYWRDDAGRSGPVLLSDEIVSRFKRAAEARGISDREFDLARAAVAKYLATLAEWPDWLRAAGAEHIAKWKSHKKLVGLCALLRAQRPPGVEPLLEQLDTWHAPHARPVGSGAVSWERQDRHLREDCDRGRVDLAERQRLWHYRTFAAWVARNYRTVVFEDLNLAKMAEAPATEEGAQTEGQAERALQRIAAPSVLRGAVQNAVGRSAGTILKVPAAYTSRDCAAEDAEGSVCGHRNKGSRELMVQCEKCAFVEDQDERACKNLLRAARTGAA